MPKFTCTERLTVKNIVAMLTIKRIPRLRDYQRIFLIRQENYDCQVILLNRARDQARYLSMVQNYA